MMKFHDDSTSLEIDSCPECYGLWFDKEELKQIFSSPNLSDQILEEGAAERLLPPEEDVARSQQQGEPRPCPVCEAQPLFSSRLGKTQLDYCLGCNGIWLDRSELEQLVTDYQSGERGNLLILNQLAEGLGTPTNPNPEALAFVEALHRYRLSLT